ncbi:hypothetical protein [uncultured Algimonas sp.]|uniref:hypothetical protein n=1 Tax=uncultured Algimonas sp. TaxID=1547920 RepID=UPI002613B5C0|nr:hypothetical protein [uncultured Algimonas sp.]
MPVLMMKRYGPLLLGALAATLIAVSVFRWINGGGVDWFSLVLAGAALALLILQFRQNGSL